MNSRNTAMKVKSRCGILIQDGEEKWLILRARNMLIRCNVASVGRKGKSEKIGDFLMLDAIEFLHEGQHPFWEKLFLYENRERWFLRLTVYFSLRSL